MKQRKMLNEYPLTTEECQAYKDAKANGGAIIIEDGWIVRVYADDTRERIKYIGETEVKIEQKDYKL